MEGKTTKSSESQYTIVKLQRNLHFLQASVLVRTVSENDNDLVLCDESESKSDDVSHQYCNNTKRHIIKKWPQSRTLVHKRYADFVQ